MINEALEEALAALPSSCQPVARHVISAGGKRLRPLLATLFARIFGHESNDIYRLASSMELLHAATLLHDDVLDEATIRRKQPASHCLFGEKKTILAGDAMLALGNAIVASYGQPALCLCFSEATSATASGEILEIDNVGRPGTTLDEYLAIASGKTGNLLAQSCCLGAIAANASPCEVKSAYEFGENLGIAFQIVDDCLDFSSEQITGKPSGGDLRERKMTPPIQLFRLSLNPEARNEFDSYFAGAEFPAGKIPAYVAAIQPFAVKARELAKKYIEKAGEVLAGLPACKETGILGKLLSQAVDRQK